jgi:hypothetical protein
MEEEVVVLDHSQSELAKNPDAPVQSQDKSWWIEDGVAASSSRPDWFPEKFKSVKDAVACYTELEKKMGTPPVAEYDFGEYAEVFDKDHEALKELAAYSKEKRVPQEVFTKVLESVSKYGKSFVSDPEVEMAKLGPDAGKRVELLNNFFKSNLSETAFNALTESMTSASSVAAMEEVRKAMMAANTVQIPSGSDNGPVGVESVDSLQKELYENLEKFKTDSKYQDDWRRRAALAGRNSDFIDKLGGTG